MKEVVDLLAGWPQLENWVGRTGWLRALGCRYLWGLLRSLSL